MLCAQPAFRPLATVVGALALLLTACSAPQAAGPAAPAGGSPAADTGPVTPRVNRLVMGQVAPLENNDLKIHGMPDVWELRPMYEYLIGVDVKTGKLGPQLATEWKFDQSEPAVRFKLRTDVNFQNDAGPLTGDDVVFSRNQLISPEAQHGQKGYYAEVTKNIEVVSPSEVVFHLTRPDGNFVRAHSENEGGFEIRSKKDFEKIGAPTFQTRPLAGTGPYQFKSRQQGSNLVYERTPYKQWRITPDFPEIEFRWMKETSTRLAALVTGEIHITGLSEDLMKEAAGKGMKVIKSQLPGTRTFIHLYGGSFIDLNDPSKGMDTSALGDARVRKAMDKAIDRDALNKAFLGSKGKVFAPVHYEPSLPGWDPSWEKRYNDEFGFDPAAAKKILADAGYGPGGKTVDLKVDLNATGSLQGSETDMMEAIGGFWRNIGINVTLDQSDNAALTALQRSRSLVNHVRIRGTSSSQYLAIWVFHTYKYASSLTGQQPYIPELDTLFGQLRSTLDEAKQAEIYKQIGEIFYTQHVNIPLFWTTTEAVINPQFVSDYTFPGSISGVWTHVDYIKAAR